MVAVTRMRPRRIARSSDDDDDMVEKDGRDIGVGLTFKQMFGSYYVVLLM